MTMERRHIWLKKLRLQLCRNWLMNWFSISQRN